MVPCKLNQIVAHFFCVSGAVRNAAELFKIIKYPFRFPRLGFMHFFSVFSAVFPWERASLPSSMRQKKLTGTKRAIF